MRSRIGIVTVFALAVAADWDAAIRRFFAEGAVFDRICSAGPPAQEAK